MNGIRKRITPKHRMMLHMEAKRKYGGAAQKAMSGRQRFIPEPG